jgi:hypothetical protein
MGETLQRKVENHLGKTLQRRPDRASPHALNDLDFRLQTSDVRLPHVEHETASSFRNCLTDPSAFHSLKSIV